MRESFLLPAPLYRLGMRMRVSQFYRVKTVLCRTNPIILFFLDNIVFFYRKMPTQNYDASYITFRKQAGVLAGYKANLNAASLANYNFVRREQPTYQSADVITMRKQGGCFCSQDASGVAFNRQTPGPCGCSR